MSILKLVLFIFCLSASNLFAESLTLSEAISEFQNSPKIEKYVSQKDEASWKKTGALSGFLPDLTFKSYHIFQQKYVYADIVFGGNPASVPNLVPATIYSLGFQLPLFDGFANINRYTSASNFEKSALNELDWARFQGEREVVLLFYKALAASTLKEVAEQNLKVLEDHLNDIQLFKKAGISTKFDVLRVEVQKSEAVTELMNASDNVMNAINKLEEVIGRDFNNRTISGKLPILKKDIVANIDSFNNERSDILSLRHKVQSLDELNKSESKFYVPKIGLFGEYQKYNNRTYDLTASDKFRNAYNIGVSLNWNLFDGMKSISRDHVSMEQKIQAEKSLRLLELKSKSDLAFWQRKYGYFCDVYNARLGDIEKSEESVRLAREGRKVGTRTNTDLLDAEVELFRARASSINAQIGSIESLINLELSLGKKIYTF